MAMFWGKAGSGMLFVCLDDNTALLVKRSESVQEPGTWGIPGGAIGEGFYESEDIDEPDVTEDDSRSSAEKEVMEELGTLPVIEREIGNTVYEMDNFRFVTYVVEVSMEEKEKMNRSMQLNWENDEAQWFEISNLPSNLHFGLQHTVEEHSLFGEQRQEELPVQTLAETPAEVLY